MESYFLAPDLRLQEHAFKGRQVTRILDNMVDLALHWRTSMIPSLRSLLKGLIVLLAATSTGVLVAQTTANQSVTLEVKPVTKISVSGNPGPLTITDAVAGSPVMSVEDNSTSYNITTNMDNMKIVASIDNPMPAGTKLEMSIASTNGLSSGIVDVSSASSPVNVVTGISRGTDAGQSISYLFTADAVVGGISGEARVITLTLTN